MVEELDSIGPRVSNALNSYTGAGQLKPTLGPPNSLRTCLRAVLVYTHTHTCNEIWGGGVVDFTRKPLLRTVNAKIMVK